MISWKQWLSGVAILTIVVVAATAWMKPAISGPGAAYPIYSDPYVDIQNPRLRFAWIHSAGVDTCMPVVGIRKDDYIMQAWWFDTTTGGLGFSDQTDGVYIKKADSIANGLGKAYGWILLIWNDANINR